jgi:hypothetical protein
MTRRSIGVVVVRHLVCALCCTIASLQPSAASEPAVDVINGAFHRAMLFKDPAMRRQSLDPFPPYLDRKIREHADKPELVAMLRMELVRVELERGNPDAAQKVASQLFSDFRKSAGSPRFEWWLSWQLHVTRAHNEKQFAEFLAKAAAGLDIKIPAQPTRSHSDEDGDGVPYEKDRCPGFDDHQDSDADGVPDGCDSCWGFPDQQDADKDGFPDGCDFCPGNPDADGDLDDVPDGCDNCVGYFNPMVPRPNYDRKHDPNCDCSKYPAPDCCWQPDEDHDGLGDPCDSTRPQKVKAIQDKSGKTLQSFEYNDFGELSRSLKWDSERSVMMITTYEYNQFREAISRTEAPQDGSAPPRKTKLYYDENHRYIGSITEGDAYPGPFVYYDNDKHLIRITEATDPPEKAKILERFERDGSGNVLKHEVFNPANTQLAEASVKKYVMNADGSREIITRERLNQNSEKMTVEGYASSCAGRPAWIEEYPRPISPPGGDPVGEPLITRFLYHQETSPRGVTLADGKTIIQPSGIREYEGWRIQGEPYKPGSTKLYEHYRTSVEKPTDSQKENWTRRTEAHFTKTNYYYLVEERLADGAMISYQRDPDDPDRVLVEEHRNRTQDGEEIVKKQSFDYSDAGRITREVTEQGGRRLTKTYDYDQQGRPTLESETNEFGTVEHHNNYDAFDRSRFRFTVVHHAEFSMALPDWFLDLERPKGAVIMQAQGIGSGDSPLIIGSDISPSNTGGNSEYVELIVEQHRLSKDTSAALDQLSAERLKAVAAGRNWESAEDGRGETIRLCGGAEGRLVKKKIKFAPKGEAGCVLLLCLRGKDDAVWLVHMVIRPVSRGRESPPGFPNVDLYQLFLTSFCTERTAFKTDMIEAQLSKISQARDKR